MPRPQRSSKRPPLVYQTPGRECSHADKGCCPRCMAGAYPPPRLYVRGGALFADGEMVIRK